VSYCLGITDIDPIKFNLLFERFLNPDRISMPDIDIDFSDRGRDQVIQYVINKYGKDNVCQIITFGTMAARAVVRDVGRVLGMSYAEVDRIAKIIPFEVDMTLERAIRLKPELKQMAQEDPRVSTLLDYSQTLEGLTRHASTHAAGVVIAPAPLTEFVPLFKGSKGEITTQYSMKWIESIGLLKMDFLGLRTLTVLEDAEKAARDNRGIKVNWDELGLEDPKVFDLFASGETTGIFQFESSGMRDYLRKLRPSVFEDIIAMNALYRPGPLDMNMIEKYIDRKQGREKVEYYHPKIEKILRDTYGVIVYQDQVMQVAAALAGFSMAKADTLRAAMGKKKADLMAQMKTEFIDGAVAQKVPRDVAEKVFDFCSTFARYGFNRAHSASYALLAYRCAWLKSHYPVEFMAALMTSEMGDTDRIRIFMRECRRLNIAVDPPDINVSHSAFTARGERIHFGLSAVKNVGGGAVDVIVQARDEGGEFSTIYDFTGRVDVRTVNRRALEALVCAGAFDRLPGHRGQLLSALDAAISYGAQSATDRRHGQASLFDGGSAVETSAPQLPDVTPWTADERLAKEKEALGFYVSSHPLLAFAEELQLFSTASTDQAGDLPDEAEVSIGGVVTGLKTQPDRKGQLMSFLTLEDFGGTLEVICFAEPYKRCASVLVNDALVLLSGRINTREGERPKMILNNAVPLSEVRGGAVLDVHARLSPELLSGGVLDDLDGLLGRYDKGNGFLFLYYPVGTETIKIRSNRVRLDAKRELVASLRELLGSESVFCTKG
jgi:DNA polymerase-3 subunit alpha